MAQAIHFIAIGGSIMHSLAISLQQQGYIVTGSDDQINDPSRSLLQQHNLLPAEPGWFPTKISPNLDAVIVGMHAKADNPELVRAQEVGVPVLSYPAFVYQQSSQKQRVLIAGSHGKSTITAIVVHTLNYYGRTFDYLIGEHMDDFPSTVRLTPNAPLIIIEGDEYASSAIDERAKFLHYQPHITLISGIAWDHVNIYPTWEFYVDSFELLAEAMPKAGILLFDESDDMLDVIGQKDRADITKIPYEVHPNVSKDGRTYLLTKTGQQIPVSLFGDHNMKNIAGAMTLLDRIGITDNQFYEAIASFKPIKGRLEKITETDRYILLRDYAHAPAKVEATMQAVKQQYPNKQLCAIVELHTLSSLNKSFLNQYKGCLDEADTAVVYVSEARSKRNSSEPIDTTVIVQAFERADLQVFTNAAALQAYFDKHGSACEVILLMSSNSSSDLDIDTLIHQLTN